MIDYGVIVIKNGISESDIYDMVNSVQAPLVLDYRTGTIHKTIQAIIEEQYNARIKGKFASVSAGMRRPDSIEIQAESDGTSSAVRGSGEVLDNGGHSTQIQESCSVTTMSGIGGTEPRKARRNRARHNND